MDAKGRGGKRARVLFGAAGVLASLAACSGSESTPDAGDAAPRPPMMSVPSCPRDTEAPLRSDDGGVRCVLVGAAGEASATEWPDDTDATAPVAYVRAGATGGAGTREAPFGDVASALAASPRPATVLLARGAHRVDALEPGAANLELRGVGSVGTTVLTGPAQPALRLNAAMTPTTLTVRGVAFRVEGGAPSPGVAMLHAQGAAATLRLRDVLVEGADRGVLVEDSAVLCAERASVREARGPGFLVRNGAHAYITSALVRDGASVGVLASRAHIVMTDSLVASNELGGIAIQGGFRGRLCSVGDTCATVAACEGVAGGFTHVRSCRSGLGAAASAPATCVSAHGLVNVASLNNTGFGIRLQRALPEGAERMEADGAAVYALPGPEVVAARLVVGGTRAPAGGVPGGDGLYVGPGAIARIDAQDGMGADAMGQRSLFVGNARVGFLVDGDGPGGDVPTRYRTIARAEVAGALVASNRGPGMFVQHEAALGRVAFSRFVDNAGLGLGVTTFASVALLQNDQFAATRPATLSTGLGAMTFGDGLSLASTGAGSALLQNDQFIDNARVGLLVGGSGSTAMLMAGNTSRNNAFGYARLDGATISGSVEALGNAAPANTPYIRESVGAAASGGR